MLFGGSSDVALPLDVTRMIIDMDKKHTIRRTQSFIYWFALVVGRRWVAFHVSESCIELWYLYYWGQITIFCQLNQLERGLESEFEAQNPSQTPGVQQISSKSAIVTSTPPPTLLSSPPSSSTTTTTTAPSSGGSRSLASLSSRRRWWPECVYNTCSYWNDYDVPLSHPNATAFSWIQQT